MADGELHKQLDAIMASGSSQPLKTTSSLTLLSNVLTSTPPPSSTLTAFALYFITSSDVPTVVSRSVLNSFVLLLCGGSGVPQKLYKPILSQSVEGENSEMAEEEKEWFERGKEVFKGDDGDGIIKEIVGGIVGTGGLPGWCEEQTTILRHILSHILERDEDWEAAAKVMMGIPLENTARMISDQQKVDVYMKIVRLLIEAQEAGQAQTYFSRASLLMHTCKDKETILSFKLSQARIFDFTRRFNEAAGRYHELSFDGDIAEEERIYMLSAAVTCAVLGPAGPQRSRILANLYRDDRTTSSLPPFKTTILRKMFLDHILRPSEIKEFASGLEVHQMAQLPVDNRIKVDDEDLDEKGDLKGRKGAGNVLDKAVMEHNIQACAKVYDNISFDGLGALLDLIPSAAEAMARQMIEQGRLRAWIDQVDRLIFFEGRNEQNGDDDVQGTAGGLGIEKQEKPIEEVTLTERWDERIRETALRVEKIVHEIDQKGYLKHGATGPSPMELT